ncbi:MAG: cobalamin biosynthesis protein CbiG [Dehalococcoidia bacterium]|nr:MAG: cobalamin biosynthesis protein CbiG [Dehalococcoidia bacterium]
MTEALGPLVFAVSQPGHALAARIASALGAEIAMREALGAAFADGRPIVAVGALGLWTRLIAPLLVDKFTEPPVIVVDDAGRFAIAVVGGHHGGNALSERVASLIGATAVVTTATDVLRLPSVEALAERYGWALEGSRAARLHVSAALVNGQRVVVYQDCGERSWLGRLPGHVHLASMPPLPDEGQVAAIFVTDRVLSEAAAWGEAAVVLRPRTLVAGVGASRGVLQEEIVALLRTALDEAGLAILSVGLIATAEIKRDEAGICSTAASLDVPVRYFVTTELAGVEVPTPSAEVARHVQTPSVCEAAALLASGARGLLVEKQKSVHATVAIARMTELAS